MRWHPFFCLLLVALCACFAPSAKAKQYKDFDQFGIDADSGSSALRADKSVDLRHKVRHDHGSATADSVNEERMWRPTSLMGLLKNKHVATKYQQLEKTESSSNEQLSYFLSVLSPETFQPNSREQLNTWPPPRDLFTKLHFTMADLKDDRIITWLKYFDTHGREQGSSDTPEHRYEALDLLLSINGVHEKDLARLFNRAEEDADLKTFSSSMKDVVKQDFQLRAMLEKDENTPEAVFNKLRVLVSRKDATLLQWLRYCQLYKTKHNMNDSVDFDSRILDVLKGRKSLDELVQLFTSIRETTGLTTYADQLLTAMRGQKNALWLEENKLPKEVYALVIKADIPAQEQLPNFVQWLEFASLYHKNHNRHLMDDVIDSLAPDKSVKSLFNGAALLDNLKKTDSVKDVVVDALNEIFKALNEQSVSLIQLRALLKDLSPSDPRLRSYENVIASYFKFLMG